MAENQDSKGPLIGIDRARCVGCFECVDTCPRSGDVEYPVYVKGEDGYPGVVNEESCIRCLSCEAGCRACAIVIRVDKGGGRLGPVSAKAEAKCRAIF